MKKLILYMLSLHEATLMIFMKTFLSKPKLMFWKICFPIKL